MNSLYIKPLIFALAFQIFFSINAYPQAKSTFTLTGKVFDKSTMQPLEYATVSVIDLKTGKTVTGAVTDEKGVFGIPGISSGKYKISTGFIGYENNTIDSISIGGKRSTVAMGNLYLSPSTRSLENVIITGDKPIIENKIDKIVYNTANDITSQGGQAIDVLKKVPQVTVDVDGNVELQGNSNIRFLIDGKPSTIFGSNLADALASIPASQIKSVEAITNPGARYDSQGTGGIINIILKENKSEGVNGSFNLSAGTRLENGSANFNLRHNNFGINAFFSGHARLKSQVPSLQQRVSTDTAAGNITYLSQDGVSDFQRHGFRSGLGFDWSISKKDDITGSIGYSQFGSQSVAVTNQEELSRNFFNDTLSDIYTLRNSNSHNNFNSIDWSLEYKKKFNKDGQILDILYSASDGRPNGNYMQTQSYLGEIFPYTGSASINPGSNKETNISIDYADPLSENFLFETGVKAIDQNIVSQSNVSVFNPSDDLFEPDNLQSYTMNYRMRIYAGYLSTTFPLFHYLNIKAGARYEYTDVNVDFPNSSIPSYGTLVPSVIISHNFSKNATLKLSYSKRIERPDYRRLNPFLNISDPYNITTGNPLLKPEIGNNFEFGYSASFEKGGNIYVALIERINTQDVKQVTTFYPAFTVGDSIYSNVSVTNSQNVGEEYNTGFSGSGSFPLTSHLNIRGTLMLMYRYEATNLSSGNTVTGMRTRVNMNLTYQLPKDLVLEMFGFYSAPSHSIQGKIPQFFIYTFAFRKLFWDKKASIGFTATNVFSKYIKQVSTISTEGYVSKNERQLPFRSFGISLSYKFGKLEFKKNNGTEDNNYLNNEAPAGN